MKAYEGIYNRFVKRVIDIVVALPFLLFAIPLYLVISLSIIVEDGRPVFYRPFRGGYKNKPFVEHKNITAYKPFTEKEIKVA